MKKSILQFSVKTYLKALLLVLSFGFASSSLHAQIFNEGFEEPDWRTGVGTGPGGSTSGQISITKTSASSTMTYYTASSSTTTVINTNPNSGVWWYSKVCTNSDTKLGKVHSATYAPKLSSSGYIITPVTSSAVASVTFWAQLGTPMTVGLATDPNVAQPSYSSSNPYPSAFGNFTTSFPANPVMTSYSIAYSNFPNSSDLTGPVRVGFFNYGGSSTYIDDIIVTAPTGTAPSVTTDNAVPGITNAVVTGTVTPGTLPLLASGIIWSTSPLTNAAADTALITKTYSHPSDLATFKDTIGILSPLTTYYTEAYVIGLDNSVRFGSVKTFTTNAVNVPTAKLVINNVYSNKINATGSVPDSGGLFVTEKGFVWNTGGSPTVTSNTGKVIEGSGGLSFTDILKGLNPSTKYCFRAYAKNSQGYGYSADSCITTGPPVPVLTAIPGVIDFGSNFFGSSPITVSYILTGKTLSPASGTITITCPAPFKVSTSAGAGFASSITINYTGGKLASTPIYVQLPTTAYGSWGYNTALTITHSGGGVSPVDADVVKLSGSITQAPEDVSNRGTEFWTGFAYQEKMKQQAGDPGEAIMALYIATGDQSADVTVDMPGLGAAGFTPQTFTIGPNSFKEVKGFPTGDPNDEMNPTNMPDARLYFTGVTNRGIHIVSTGAPVSVWMHTWTTGNSAAAAMLFPTNTWNSSYTVQAYGGTSNNSNPNSFFFVIASEDNTKLTFTPSNDILAYIVGQKDQAGNGTVFNEGHTPPQVLYKKGVTYTDAITLNKGEIFNAMGFISGSTGLDLTGTTVQTSCDKKIAVFGGNGRVLVKPVSSSSCGTDGSDHLVQQMFPTVAWGTKYLTVPTKNMEYNYYRVVVQDPTTVVTVKPASINKGTLVNGLYYQFDSNVPLDISSDKPINVTQFIIQGSCKTASVGNPGNGDPEMIILSPVQQAINKVTVYSAGIKKAGGGSNGNYINVIIEKAAIDNKSFSIDGIDFNNVTTKVDTGSAVTVAFGSSLVFLKDAFKPHPQDPNYYFAKFKVAALKAHTISSNYTFNAIAYGMGDGESYGYNAGTLIKNLSSIKFTDNPNGSDTSSTVVRTCKENPVTLKIALPYNPSQVTKIDWVPGGDPRITPNTTATGPVQGGTAKYDGTIIAEDGRTFYVYSSPVKYQFSDLAVYNFTVIAYGTFKSDCPGEDRQKIIVVVGRDNAYFEPKAACGSPTVTIDNFTTAMANTNITKTTWDFGDGTTSSIADPGTHTYNLASGTYYKIKLTTVNSIGCNSEYETEVDFGGGLKAEFTKDPVTAICQNGSYNFTDNTSATGTSGTPNKWEWNFGDGSPVVSQTSPTVQTHTYTTAGKFGVKLTVTTNQGCLDTYIDSVTVEATPVAKFAATTACLGDSIIFTDQSTITIGTIDIRSWNFGDGSPVLDDNTARAAHKYATSGEYEVSLTVKSSGGCPSAVYKLKVTVLALPINLFDKDVDCTNKKVTFTDKSTTAAGTIVKRHWNFGDGTRDDNNVVSPTHSYSGTGPYTATLWVETSNGCQDSANKATVTFSIAASPVSSFSLPGNICLPNAVATFANTSTITDGTEAEFTNAWDFGDGSPAATSTGLASIQHTYTGAGPYTVKLVTTSKFGCTSTATPKIVNTIFTQPKASFTPPAEVCVNAKAALSSTGTAAGSAPDMWYWSFDGTDNYGTLSKKDTVAAWATDGTQTIKHYLVSKVGCVSDTVSKSITVNPLPVNLFDKDIDCSIKKVTFTDKSTAAVGTITKRHWVFGDGARDDGNNATVSHTYSGTGPYTATLWVESSKGCQDSANRASVTFTISATPASSFTLPVANICLPAGIATFTNTSTIADGTEAGFVNSWDFGDGTKKDTSFGLASIQHSYTGVGPYTVKLTTTSVNGCNNTATPKILNTIYAQPKATFTAAPAEACLNSNASFSSTGSAAASTAADWYWDLGTGSFGTLSKKDTVAAWSVPGDKTIRHYIVSAVGCISDTANKTVTVNSLPTASFTQVAVGCAGKEVAFTDGSATTTTGATITEWNWNFGDGNKLKQTTAAAVKHTYATGGSYPATLVIRDSKGCISDTFRLTVDVYPNPVPLFTVTDICLPTIQPIFTDASTITSGSVTDWSWNFGDGTPAVTGVASTPHNYIAGNIYKVTLTATSDKGCTTTGAAVDVTATSAPIASDSIINSANLCSSSPVTLIDQSVPNGFGTVSKIEIFWNGVSDATNKTVDNAPATGGTYTHKYPDLSADQNYEVVIRAYSASGCYKDSARTIALLASPSLTFNAIPGICEEKDTIQIDVPQDANNLPIRTAFFSGEGITDSAGSFFPALAGPGNHLITYTDTATNGCVSKASQSVFVYATPTIKMDATKAVMLGDKIKLNPTITGNIQTYLWDPATYLDADNIKAPISTPAADITYTLTVTSKDGCEADSSVAVKVLKDFGVPNTFTPNNDGINDNWVIEELPSFPIQKVQVFNRYGQIVYETKKYNPLGWDGTYKGKPLPFGTYYYIIELNGMVEPKVGYVTIIK
ncbi:PKD domain-containing protein [Ferruginibacter lapsinanis]|uniref:PKD domain-containing protein n=1 Tax=Ferruginibacter lapsinanis TaxID=563172 RepID=UPI001E36B53D|nr:PKD domain-containing protein [Ferruginibacter lapsinanis]UEG49505.1 PKD domain-containing protein [Ferruginibacter lapsinanis]